MRELVIFGSGGHAREIAQLVRDINAVTPTWRLLGFADGDTSKHGTQVASFDVLGGVDWVRARLGVHVVVAIGNTAARRKVALALDGIPLATLVHPQAIIGERVVIGAGTMVCAKAVMTCDVVVGKHAIINVASTVSHDVVLDEFVTLAPNVSLGGGVSIGSGTDIGIGAVAIQNVRIGAWSVIGAGAAVVDDVADNVTAVGVPARVIKTREPGWYER